MPLAYTSGEEIQQGDRILYAGAPGTVEFIAKAGDPETQWYVEQFGRGCMIRTTGMGSVFLNEPETDEDLELVARTDSSGRSAIAAWRSIGPDRPRSHRLLS